MCRSALEKMIAEKQGNRPGSIWRAFLQRFRKSHLSWLVRALLGLKKKKKKKVKRWSNKAVASNGLEVRDSSCDPLLEGEDVVDDDDADDEAEEEEDDERGIE